MTTSLPLSQFPSLTKPLSTSHLIGILFASSWCPDCTPIFPALKKIHDSQPPPPSDKQKKHIEIIYVSSDNTPNEMSQLTSSLPFTAIPFVNVAERTRLKKHFDACAGKEAVGLGMVGKKYGIPTLVILEGATGRVVTMDGVDDLLGEEDVLKKWMKGVDVESG